MSNKEDEVVKNLTSHLGEEKIIEAKTPRRRRIFISIALEALRDALRLLFREQKFRHLSTITGVDLRDGIEIIYHLYDGEVALSLKATVSKANPRLPTVVDIIPGAVLYEREVYELFGVVFEGHPNLSPLILPDGWPSGIYPLRKDWDIERIKEEIAKVEGER